MPQGWPKSMPFLAVATQGSMLSLGTAMLPKEIVPIHSGNMLGYALHVLAFHIASSQIDPNWQNVSNVAEAGSDTHLHGA